MGFWQFTMTRKETLCDVTHLTWKEKKKEHTAQAF